MIKLNLKTSLLAITSIAVGLSVPSSTRAVSLTSKETSVVLGGAKQLVVGVNQNSTTNGANIIDQSSIDKEPKQLKQAKNINRVDQGNYASQHNANDSKNPKRETPQVIEEPAPSKPVDDTPVQQPAPQQPIPEPTPNPEPQPQPPVETKPATNPDQADIQNYVYQGLLQRGWSQSAAQTMVGSIIGRESGWNPQIVNQSSGAFGLFQLMPLHGAYAGMSVDAQMDLATSISGSGSNLSPWSETWY